MPPWYVSQTLIFNPALFETVLTGRGLLMKALADTARHEIAAKKDFMMITQPGGIL